MSNTNDLDRAGLMATQEALTHLERSMFSLQKERARYHPQQYAIMAGPTAEEIVKLRAQIDELIGLPEFATSSQQHNPMPPVETRETGTPPVVANGARPVAPASSNDVKS